MDKTELYPIGQSPCNYQTSIKPLLALGHSLERKRLLCTNWTAGLVYSRTRTARRA
jgi:hypothetical protein